MNRLSKTLILVPLILALSACAHQRHRDRDQYSQYTAPAYTQQTQYGLVRSIEQHEVRAPRQASGGGALAGAVIGGVLGNQMGRGNGRAAMTAIGVIGGAMAGDAIERDGQGGGGSAPAYRVRVRLDTGGEAQFDFQDLAGLKVGDRVRLDGGRLQRL
jgi:outer membrane lipoprotein SlyB